MRNAQLLDEGQLMTRVASGDRQAFETLMVHYKDSLVNYLTHLTGAYDRAEEYAQEAFLKLFLTAGRYHHDGRFAPYLFRIATNLVRSDQRREGRWRRLLPLLAQSTPDQEPASQRQVLALEIQSQVSRAIRDLPLRFRIPLILHELEGWPYQRIAELQGCQQGTVKSRVYRARQRLRASLAPYWNGSVP